MPAHNTRAPRPATARGLLVGVLVFIFAFESPISARMRVLPAANSISVVGPWRYYDLWKALRRGRGVVVGTTTGESISGKFLYGGSASIEVSSENGTREIPIPSIRYLINVIDLSHSRDGAMAGGLIGLGTGFTLSYLSNDGANGSGSTNPRPARTTADDESSSSDGQSTTSDDSQSTNSESSTNTTPSASSTESGQSSQSTAGDNGGAASSSSSSSGSDPTQTGSNTYGSGSSSTSSDQTGGSSTGGSQSEPSPTSTNSSQSNGGSNTVVYVGGESQSSNRSSSGTAQPSGGSSVSPALRMFFFSVGFAALGTFVGWLVGRRIRKSVPRVDYVILSEQDKERAERSPDQYLADLMTQPAGDQAAESLLPGSSFDSQRSATLFSQFGSAGTPVRLNGSMNATVTASDARTYRLFPTVRNFEQAMIVSWGGMRERTGSECRYLAVVTRKVGGEPLVSLQRLSPRDIVRMSTQINLIRAGILP